MFDVVAFVLLHIGIGTDVHNPDLLQNDVLAVQRAVLPQAQLSLLDAS